LELIGAYWGSIIQQDLRDDAGGDGDQHVIVAGLDPVMAARRFGQVMAAPVVDDVLVAAVVVRNALTSAEVVARTGTAWAVIVLCVLHAVVAAFDASTIPVIVAAVVSTVVAGLRAMSALVALRGIVAAIAAIAVMVLGVDCAACKQGHTEDSCKNLFHVSLLLLAQPASSADMAGLADRRPIVRG
jgi:hypothetical protein